MSIHRIVYVSFFPPSNFPFSTLSQFISASSINCLNYFYKLIQSINIDLSCSSFRWHITMFINEPAKIPMMMIDPEWTNFSISDTLSSIFFCCTAVVVTKCKSHLWRDVFNQANCESGASNTFLMGVLYRFCEYYELCRVTYFSEHKLN